MEHIMRLHNDPFNKIKDGTKTIELRLNDEKRRLISIDDTIVFENRTTEEIIKVRVIKLYKYDNFEELFKHFNSITLGYEKKEIPNPKDMNMYYSKEKQEKYGVVGIEIRKI